MEESITDYVNSNSGDRLSSKRAVLNKRVALFKSVFDNMQATVKSFHFLPNDYSLAMSILDRVVQLSESQTIPQYIARVAAILAAKEIIGMVKAAAKPSENIIELLWGRMGSEDIQIVLTSCFGISPERLQEMDARLDVDRKIKKYFLLSGFVWMIERQPQLEDVSDQTKFSEFMHFSKFKTMYANGIIDRFNLSFAVARKVNGIFGSEPNNLGQIILSTIRRLAEDEGGMPRSGDKIQPESFVHAVSERLYRKHVNGDGGLLTSYDQLVLYLDIKYNYWMMESIEDEFKSVQGACDEWKRLALLAIANDQKSYGIMSHARAFIQSRIKSLERAIEMTAEVSSVTRDKLIDPVSKHLAFKATEARDVKVAPFTRKDAIAVAELLNTQAYPLYFQQERQIPAKSHTAESPITP